VLPSGVFKDLAPFVQLRGRPGELDSVKLLEAVERARYHAVVDGRDRAERHELVVRTGYVDVP
jgi:hypothetical protein